MITTDRLVIREFQEKDIDDLIRNINDLEVSKNTANIPYPYKADDAHWWVAHCQQESKKAPRENYEFAVELKSEKKLVGGIGFTHVHDGIAEIGYWLGRDYWRKGFMSEAAKAMVEFGFKKVKLSRIDLKAFTENIASNELAKKLGFIYEKTEEKAATSKADGTIHDHNLYALSREGWKR